MLFLACTLKGSTAWRPLSPEPTQVETSGAHRKHILEFFTLKGESTPISFYIPTIFPLYQPHQNAPSHLADPSCIWVLNTLRTTKTHKLLLQNTHFPRWYNGMVTSSDPITVIWLRSALNISGDMGLAASTDHSSHFSMSKGTSSQPLSEKSNGHLEVQPSLGYFWNSQKQEAQCVRSGPAITT